MKHHCRGHGVLRTNSATSDCRKIISECTTKVACRARVGDRTCPTSTYVSGCIDMARLTRTRPVYEPRTPSPRPAGSTILK
ncbi:unnamed protein product [Leptidea sinapis]|uniref:Uncharacterized protein n=1 Tax=Leptidea sinapis TaxID=189913 RepID=A0A5E4QE57_9NEOP|nr:unnamed protein product [Leptidea sinapis]